jgi:hypothetical protein
MPEPAQHARFGPIRAVPPAAVRDRLGVKPGGIWAADRLGDEGGFPNGGMWRFRCRDEPAASAVVKRTGAHHLGTDQVWRGSADPCHPQWWGREAEFYRSDLAVGGWNCDCRAAMCYDVEDHDGVRDLWLEDVSGIPLPRAKYAALVGALARWQLQHRRTDLGWLSRGWIPTHVGRRGLDNARTLAHPEWSRLIDLGMSPSIRDNVRYRITDPSVIASVLNALPKVLTHYDFHHMNIGEVDGQIVIIDWATVGWGPVGHDVGFMLIDHALDLGEALESTWNDLVRCYVGALQSAGGDFDPAEIERSVAVSNVIRHGSLIDRLLDNSPVLADQQIKASFPLFNLFAEFQSRYGVKRLTS